METRRPSTAPPAYQLVDAALSREEVAWASYSALHALAFVGAEDLRRELYLMVQHNSLGDATSPHAPQLTESTISDFLRLHNRGIPEGYHQFVSLYNNLIDWADRQSTSATAPGQRPRASFVVPDAEDLVSPSKGRLSRAAQFNERTSAESIGELSVNDRTTSARRMSMSERGDILVVAAMDVPPEIELANDSTAGVSAQINRRNRPIAQGLEVLTPQASPDAKRLVDRTSYRFDFVSPEDRQRSRSTADELKMRRSVAEEEEEEVVGGDEERRSTDAGPEMGFEIPAAASMDEVGSGPVTPPPPPIVAPEEAAEVWQPRSLLSANVEGRVKNFRKRRLSKDIGDQVERASAADAAAEEPVASGGEAPPPTAASMAPAPPVAAAEVPPLPPPPPEVKMPPPMAETAIGLKAASSPACLAGPLTAPPVMTSGFSCASVASLSSTSAAPPAPTLKAAVSMPAAAPAEPASHLVEGGYEARTLLGGFEEGARRNAKADMLLGQLTKKTAPAQPAPQSSSWGGEVTRKDRRGKGSDGRVECPHCKRLFALALAPRHCQLCPDRYVAARLPAPPPQPVQRQLPASHSTGGPGLTTSIRSAAIPSMASKAGALDHTPPRARLGLRPSASWASASGGPRSVGTTGLTTSASMASTTSASPSSIISSRLLRPEEAPLMRQTSLPGRPDGHAWRSFIARIS